jgi:rhodanese-related sulfurtransferase/DNA-binding transcriptional ArsR family regulator
MATGPKQTLFEELARIAQALGHAHRLGILEQVAQGERTVEVLALANGLSVANASQHLKLLRSAGLVASRRDGKFVRYRIADDSILDLLAALRQTAERNSAEVRRVLNEYFWQRDSMEAIPRVELQARIELGLVTVLDVRPHDEFMLGHLPGSLNVPLDQLEARLSELDPAQEIVAYCRGAYCVLSFDAIARLRALGFNARRLEDGYPEWRAAGLPCEGCDAHQ